MQTNVFLKLRKDSWHWTFCLPEKLQIFYCFYPKPKQGDIFLDQAYDKENV